MNVQTAKSCDLPEIMAIYDKARSSMRASGNYSQWINGYPQRELIEKDMKNGDFFIIKENDKIIGAFSFIIGNDPTYEVIENGTWSSNKIYGTIHRLASDGSMKGVAKCCFDFCSNKISYLRIDTHADNKPMQAAVEKYGFKKCGIIYVSDGSPRIAYDLNGRIKN